MSGTLTVRELIKELLEFDMDEPVFIALGSVTARPSGSGKIVSLRQFDSNITCGFGVYLNPNDTLIDEEMTTAELLRLRSLEQTLLRARAIAAEQAENDGLWVPALYISEAYLREALRRLTAAVEGEQ